MSVRRQRPEWVAPHRPLIQALGIRDLWVPQGGRIFNLAPGPGDLAADTATKWSTGPGGYGLDTQNVTSQGYSSSAQVVRSLPRTQATMFGVISVRSATSGQIYRFGYGGDTRYMIRMAFDATNGLKSGNVTGGYATSDEQSMGVLPPLGHPFAFVALYSFAYNGAEDRRELHDSYGNKVLTASNSAWDAIDSGYVRIGNDYQNAFDGHVYMVGSSERIWKQNEVEEFLADPYRLIDGTRQRSRQVYVAPAGGDAELGGVTLAATASLIAGSATAASTAAAATLTAASSIITGSATANSVVAGVTLTATSSLIPGSASGSSTGTASGVTLTATASLIAGAAAAASTAAGTTLTATASIIAGSASGSAAGTANGVTLTGTATLITGAASASSTATGQTLNITASLIAGAASGGAAGTASGATIAATSTLVSGAASAASAAPSVTWAMTATVIAGGAQAGNPRPASSRVFRSRGGTRLAKSR